LSLTLFLLVILTAALLLLSRSLFGSDIPAASIAYARFRWGTHRIKNPVHMRCRGCMGNRIENMAGRSTFGPLLYCVDLSPTPNTVGIATVPLENESSCLVSKRRTPLGKESDANLESSRVFGFKNTTYVNVLSKPWISIFTIFMIAFELCPCIRPAFFGPSRLCHKFRPR